LHGAGMEQTQQAVFAGVEQRQHEQKAAQVTVRVVLRKAAWIINARWGR